MSDLTARLKGVPEEAREHRPPDRKVTADAIGDKTPVNDDNQMDQRKGWASKDTDVVFEENEDAIIIKWVGTNNVNGYKIKVKRTFLDENFPKNTQEPHCELKKDTYGWKTGERIIVDISVLDEEYNSTVIFTGVEYVVGGDTVPCEVSLELNKDKPYESLILKWQKAKKDPQKYEVTVYQKVGNADQLSQTLTTNELSLVIGNLRHLTETYCVIKCKYSDSDGKPVWSKPLKTAEVPRETKNVQRVFAYKDPENRVRRIIVKWDEPEQFEVTHYEVCLAYENQRMRPQRIDGDKPRLAYFRDLKSATEYKAYVISMGKANKHQEASSEAIVTDEAEKVPGFNIEEKGKAIIKVCNFQQKGDDLYGKFEWSLPDLGRESNNYNMVSNGATVKEDGRHKVVLDVDKKNCKAENAKLSWGKSYTFTVTCSYLEYDTDIIHEASVTEILVTEIGKPTIDGVDWRNNDITVLWSAGKEAKKHTFRVVHETKELLSQSVKHSPARIPIEHYGKECDLFIESHKDGHEIKTATKRVLIGGNEAVTQVRATKDEINPRHAIVVNWKPPKRTPQGYKVILKDLSNNNVLEDEVNALEARQNSHRFIDLKSKTKYCVTVCPIYNGAALQGTLSNSVKTDKKVTLAAEYEAGFGQTENIMDAATESTQDEITVTLSWIPVRMGENYKVKGYHVLVYQKGFIRNTVITTKKVDFKTTQVDLDLKRGEKYEVKVTTQYIDLDTGKTGDIAKDHEIFTDPSKTIINDCISRNGAFHFSWQSVGGAKKYTLIVQDVLTKKELHTAEAKVTAIEDGCSKAISMSEKLRIGLTCMTKVIAHTEGGQTSESELKVHLLGGKEVPRNVTACKNSENPTRAVNLSFDSPARGPTEEYKVVIVPQSGGNTRTIHCKTNTIVLEYLRKGIQYKFDVYAMWESGWSEASPSNLIQTDGGTGKPMVDVHGSKQTSVDLSNAVLAGQINEFNVHLGKDFGQVEDLRSILKPDRDKDMLTLIWNVPTFDKKADDYKVENYRIEIFKGQDRGNKARRVDFEKGKHQYESEAFALDLGQNYHVALSTIYLDIDQDKIYKSSCVMREVPTRPSQPTCTRNSYTEEALTIEWNAAKGAQNYWIEVFVDGAAEPTFRKDMGKETVYHKEFDASFGFGSTYYAVIKAFGANGMSNSDQTLQKIIGGDKVPTNVEVTSDHTKVKDPNTEVFLKWKPPQCSAISYEIVSIPLVESMMVEFNGEECLVSGLKAGTEYFFKVKAVHEENGQRKLSGGCSSKKIRTNPTPTQVKNVSTCHGKNPSTSVEISWDKVNAEKPDETTKYRVCLMKDYGATKRELNVGEEKVILHDLEPGSSYHVTVAGGNSDGYGKDSEVVKFSTKLGTPKNAVLQNNPEHPNTSLILRFESAEGQAKKYKATLYRQTDVTQQELSGWKEVVPGQTYNDLEPNAKYLVKLFASYPSGDGEIVESNNVITAASKPRIDEAGCALQNGEKSTREILAKWSSDNGCTLHEVKIMRGSTRTIESRVLVENKQQLQYLCLYESTEYAIQVRSRNASCIFGEWSNEYPINLAPPKLEGVFASLEKDGENILVKCSELQKHSPFYFMQAFQDKELIGQQVQSHAKDKVVEWKFKPPENAQKYHFQLWAEDSLKCQGAKTSTNDAVSRPAQWRFKTCRLHADNPSTDIQMEWDYQERCDTYEITVCVHDQQMPENILRTKSNMCRYRCEVPGSKYLVSMRAICADVHGEWSDDQEVVLAPAEVEIMERSDMQIIPVENVSIEWKPPKIPSGGYLLTLLTGDCVQEEKEKQSHATKHVFESNLKPGLLYYCIISAFNDAEGRVFGKPSRSKNYRIKWRKASNFAITYDENETSQRVKMRWDAPDGVNCYKLEMENNQSGVVTTVEISDTRYVFDSGIPGNTYTVRLHCGCDSRYDIDYVQQNMTIKPLPPTGLKVRANDNVNGLAIEIKDTQYERKQYALTIQGLTNPNDRSEKVISQRSLILRNLVPGESYKVSVCTIIRDQRSGEIATEGYTSTFPAGVENLRSKIENGSILFEWDKLEIKPTKYVVQWRVNNEDITEEQTQDTSFMIFFLKPAHCYSARVMAANSSGFGPMSSWQNFITDPSPPHSIKVYRDPESPETSLIVKFQDDKDQLKRYQIMVEGAKDKAKTIVTHEQFAIIPDLHPGCAYMVKVKTLFCGKESAWAQFSRIDD